MYNFDNSVSCTCPICVGHSEGTCFYKKKLSQALHYLDSQALLIEVTQPQTLLPKLTERKEEIEESKAKGTYKRDKKDNIAYKLYDVLLEKIFSKLTKKKIDQQYRGLYCRKEYFVIVMSLLERKGKSDEAQICFVQEMEAFMENLEIKHQSKPEYMKLLRKLCKDRLRAFSEFNSGSILQSLKTVFDYDNMRHKAKFSNAVESVRKIRKAMGLSF